VALAATCVAALMTASNLGVRVTGWGFVVFTIGAAAWVTVGLFTHQAQLLYSNIFLLVVDIFGSWRWLGHRARIADTVGAEEKRSERRRGDKLFSVATLDGMPVSSANDQTVAHVADALAASSGGGIDYLIVRLGGVGGIGESLHRLPWSEVSIVDGTVRTKLGADAIARLPKAIEG
jgi:hypothetical protein